jgi:hypothetical protein
MGMKEFGVVQGDRLPCSPDGYWFREACVAASKVDALAKWDAVASIAQNILERYKRSRCAAPILVPEVN